MSTQLDLLLMTKLGERTEPSFVADPPPPGLLSSFWEQSWTGPTVGEFSRRIEHEFGMTLDLVGPFLAGMSRSERLGASDVRVVCEQLGLPPEDFGVEP